MKGLVLSKSILSSLGKCLDNQVSGMTHLRSLRFLRNLRRKKGVLAARRRRRQQDLLSHFFHVVHVEQYQQKMTKSVGTNAGFVSKIKSRKLFQAHRIAKPKPCGCLAECESWKASEGRLFLNQPLIPKKQNPIGTLRRHLEKSGCRDAFNSIRSGNDHFGILKWTSICVSSEPLPHGAVLQHKHNFKSSQNHSRTFVLCVTKFAGRPKCSKIQWNPYSCNVVKHWKCNQEVWF